MKTDLLEKYSQSLPEKNAMQFISIAGKFLQWLGNKEFSAQNIKAYLQFMKEENYSSGTISFQFGVIHRLCVIIGFEWPLKRSDHPVIPEHEIEAPALDPYDIKRMVDIVRSQESPQLRAFLAVSTVYGLRPGEIGTITPSSLSLKDKLILIETAKRGRQRYHIIPDVILPHLQEYGFTVKVSSTQLRVLFVNLKVAVGLKMNDEVGWHAIRRSAIRAAFEGGLGG